MAEPRSTPYVPTKVPPLYVASLTLLHCVVFGVTGVVINWICPTLPWWSALISCYTGQIYALCTHMLGHRRVIPWWFNAHMGHHIHDYPPSAFLSPAYKPAVKDNSSAYYLTFLLTPLTTCALLGDWSAVAFVHGAWPIMLLLKLADEIHMRIHAQGHSWEGQRWFEVLRALHFHHHKGDCKRNYAIGDFWLDTLMSTLHL